MEYKWEQELRFILYCNETTEWVATSEEFGRK